MFYMFLLKVMNLNPCIFSLMPFFTFSVSKFPSAFANNIGRLRSLGDDTDPPTFKVFVQNLSWRFQFLALIFFFFSKQSSLCGASPVFKDIFVILLTLFFDLSFLFIFFKEHKNHFISIFPGKKENLIFPQFQFPVLCGSIV